MSRSSFFIFILIALFVFSTFARAQSSAESRRNELASIVDEELKEIVRLNKMKRGNDPQLLLRMAEGYLDKARIVKEIELAKFMATETKNRSGIDKGSFFSNSNRFYSQAQKIGHHILEKFPQFKDKSDVYYILAYNAKEFQDNAKAFKYFELAVKGASEGSQASKRSKIALAEMLYLKGQYEKAIPLYAAALKGDKDKWWTKDAYNLAWSYFREEKFDEAIAIMKGVFEASKDKKFVDMSYNATKDLAYFYASAGQPQKAVEFYKTIGGDASASLYRVAKNLLGFGKFTIAETLLAEALKISPDPKMFIKINLELLLIYEKYGKTELHLKNCENLVSSALKKQLSDDELDELKLQALKMSALLQQQIVAKTYDKQPEMKSNKANLAVSYFKILAQLEPQKAHEHYFHAAETFYAALKYNEALPLYDQAQDLASKARDKKTAELSMTGLMAALGQKEITKENEAKYLVQAYSDYLRLNPRSQKSFTIYQRLFNAQIDKKEIESAEKTLMNFKQSFPESVDKQEAMLARLIDHYKEKNDKANLKKWVARINNREIYVSAPVAKKIRLLMLSMQFDNVETLNTKGDKSKALKLYVEIYKDKDNTPDAKKNASYNIMTLFYQLGDMEKTYLWAERALAFMNEDDILKYESSFLLVTAELYNRRHFKESAFLDEIILKKICLQNSKNKEIFLRNAIVLQLAEGRIEEAREIIKNASRCNISSTIMTEVQLDVLESLAESERWNSYEDQINQLENNSKTWPELIRHLDKLSSVYEASGKNDKTAQVKNRMMKLYQNSLSQKMDIPLLSLDAIALVRLEEIEKEVQRLDSIVLAFPEKTYNERLKQKFFQLDNLTSKTLDILNIGSGVGIVQSYHLLIENYKKTANLIKNFTPPDKSVEYISSFKKSMEKIYTPLLDKADEFLGEAKKQIETNKILSSHNNEILMQGISDFRPEYEYRSGGILMDRGGRR